VKLSDLAGKFGLVIATPDIHKPRAKQPVEFKQLSDGQIIKVSTKVLVDATGFARAIMYEKENDKPDFLSGTGIEYLIEVEPEVYNKYSGDLIFFLGDKWMPKGYSWIFPMEPNRLKVGAGRIFLDPKTVRHLSPLKKYIDLLIDEYLKSKNYKIIDKHGSRIGAIKSLFPFLLPATKFSLFPRFSCLSPYTFFPFFDHA
jgi:flavin-dependent dehydrogenase